MAHIDNTIPEYLAETQELQHHMDTLVTKHEASSNLLLSKTYLDAYFRELKQNLADDLEENPNEDR